LGFGESSASDPAGRHTVSPDPVVGLGAGHHVTVPYSFASTYQATQIVIFGYSTGWSLK